MNIQNAQKIAGWMTDAELLYLAELADKATIIVEAGCFQGRSTRAMADNTSGIIHAVDPWKPVILAGKVGVDEQTYTRFSLNLHEHIRNGRVIPHAMKFHEFDIEDDPDFIFIDGMHDYESVKRDIDHALRLMPYGGILAGHDYMPGWPGVIQAVREAFGEVSTVDTIWTVEV